MGDFTTAGEVESVTAHEVINNITGILNAARVLIFVFFYNDKNLFLFASQEKETTVIFDI
jgi:hypothetical protein